MANKYNYNPELPESIYNRSENLKYRLTLHGLMLGHSSIPEDEGNVHYQEYLDWVAEGNTPEEPADE
jgi:hypothetical protein